MDSTGNGQHGFNTAANTTPTPEFMSSFTISRSGTGNMSGQMTGSVYSGESAPYFTPQTQRYTRSNTIASNFSQESGNTEPVFYSPQSWEGPARSRMGSVSSSVQYNSSHGHPQRVQHNVLRSDNANYYGSPERSYNTSGQQVYTPQGQWNTVGQSSAQHNVMRPDNSNYYDSPQRSYNPSGQQVYTPKTRLSAAGQADMQYYGQQVSTPQAQWSFVEQAGVQNYGQQMSNPQTQWNIAGQAGVQNYGQQVSNPQAQWNIAGQAGVQNYGQQVSNPQAQWNIAGQAGVQNYGQQGSNPQAPWNIAGQAGVQNYGQQMPNPQAQWDFAGQAGVQQYGHQYLPHNALGEYNTHFQGSQLGYKQSTSGPFALPLTDEAIAHGYIPPPLTYTQVASSSTSTTQPPGFFPTEQYTNPINTRKSPAVRKSKSRRSNNMQKSSAMEAPDSSTARVHQTQPSEAAQESDMPARQGGDQQTSSSANLWQRPVPSTTDSSSSSGIAASAPAAAAQSKTSNQLSEGAVDLNISARHGGNSQLPLNMAPPRSFTSFNAQSASFRPSNSTLAQSYRPNQLPPTTMKSDMPARQAGTPQTSSAAAQSSHGNPLSLMGDQSHANVSQPIQSSQFSGNSPAFNMSARQPAHSHPSSMNPSQQVSLAELFQRSQISENAPASSMPTNYPVNTNMSPMGPPARPINPPVSFQSSSMGPSSQSSTQQYQPSGLSQNTTHFDSQTRSEAATGARLSSNAMRDTTRFPNNYTVKDFEAYLLPEHRNICPESLAGYNNCKCGMEKLCEDFNNEQHGDECYEGEYCWMPHIKYSCESSILGNGCREAETGVKIAGRTMHERFRKHWREGERDDEVWSRQASASLRWAHSIGEWPEQK